MVGLVSPNKAYLTSTSLHVLMMEAKLLRAPAIMNLTQSESMTYPFFVTQDQLYLCSLSLTYTSPLFPLIPLSSLGFDHSPYCYQLTLRRTSDLLTCSYPYLIVY